MLSFKQFLNESYDDSVTKDHTTHPLHKTAIELGFKHVSSAPNSHRYGMDHPTGGRKSLTLTTHANGNHGFHHGVHTRTDNPGPDVLKKAVSTYHKYVHGKDMSEDYPVTPANFNNPDERIKTTVKKTPLPESVSPAEHELNAPSHKTLSDKGYQMTGHKRDGNFRKFTYKHPEHGTVHTYVNPHANEYQQVQHRVNGNPVYHTGDLASKIGAR